MVESSRKKQRISETTKTEIENNEKILKRWRTNRVQQIYASKLFQSLRRIRQRPNETDKITGTAREIRETADRVLAASARGTTRWSRAILATRLKKHKKVTKSSIGGRCYRSRNSVTKTTEIKRIKLPAVERKLKILGRLVPGCKKISVPKLLDEATDYIAALEMQVRAMEALAELLASSAASRSSTTTLTGGEGGS